MRVLLLIMHYSVMAEPSVLQAGLQYRAPFQLLHKNQLTPQVNQVVNLETNDGCSNCLLPTKKNSIPSTCSHFDKTRTSSPVNFLSALLRARGISAFPFSFAEQVVKTRFQLLQRGILTENLEQATFRKTHISFSFSNRTLSLSLLHWCGQG